MKSYNHRPQTQINAGSMADIAFLLLIFFLVTTTMDIEKGILVILPEWIDTETTILPKHPRNVLNIMLNKADQLMIEGKVEELNNLKPIALKHINNFGLDPDFSEHPQKALISLKNDSGTTYERYISVQNELKAAYNETRENYALENYGLSFKLLKPEQQEQIRKLFPIYLSEAEVSR